MTTGPVRRALDGPEGRSPAPEPGEEPLPRPDIHKLGAAGRRWEVRTVSLLGMFVLAVLYTMYFARALLFPIVLAILLDFLLSPVLRGMRRVRIPEYVGAALLIVAALGTVGFGVYELAGPAQEWVQRAPRSLGQLDRKLKNLRKPMEQVSRTAEQVEKATAVSSNQTPEVVVKGPSLTQRVFGTTQTILATAFEVVVLLFFLLAAGDLFMQKLVKVLPAFRDKKRAVTIAREIEQSISTYLSTVLLINVGQGVVVGIAMYLHGMPNPILWGALSALAEFVPYLGSTALLVIFTLVGLLTYPSLAHALAIPATYLGINLIQSQVVTPMVLGHRLTLNPVAIFIGIIFWFWMWGVAGAFIAVPLLAALKIFCDHIEALAPIGEFLGQ